MFDLHQLITREDNPRKITKKAADRLKKSVTEFSKMLALRPIIYDPVPNDDGLFPILGGRQRTKQLIESGLTEVPDEWVKSAAEFTEEEKKRFIITDNESYGTYDIKLLQEHWDVDQLKEWDFSINMVEEFDMPEEPDFDAENKTDGFSGEIVKGDLIEIGPHRLICGDSLSSDTVAKLMDNKLATMVFTDPPYNVKIDSVVHLGKTKHNEFAMASGEMSQTEFTDFLRAVFSNLILFSKDGSIHFICMDWKHMNELLTAGGGV